VSGAPSSTLVVSDLDGTLLDSAARLRAVDRATLEGLGAARIVRVVATGRSLWSARRVLADDFPIDYLIFSSGVGVVEWRRGRLLRLQAMTAPLAERVATRLTTLDLDFMVHHAAPDNHRFYYRRASRGERSNPDFERRCRRYRQFSAVWPGRLPAAASASQLLVVEHPRAASRCAALTAELHDCNVVRTTSPLDHVSSWIEIFPPTVAKSIAADWLCRRCGVDPGSVLALGNDYNDRDLLAWAGTAKVVANAPAELRARYPAVASNDAGGFSEAVRGWRSRV